MSVFPSSLQIASYLLRESHAMLGPRGEEHVVGRARETVRYLMDRSEGMRASHEDSAGRAGVAVDTKGPGLTSGRGSVADSTCLRGLVLVEILGCSAVLEHGDDIIRDMCSDVERLCRLRLRLAQVAVPNDNSAGVERDRSCVDGQIEASGVLAVVRCLQNVREVIEKHPTVLTNAVRSLCGHVPDEAPWLRIPVKEDDGEVLGAGKMGAERRDSDERPGTVPVRQEAWGGSDGEDSDVIIVREESHGDGEEHGGGERHSSGSSTTDGVTMMGCWAAEWVQRGERGEGRHCCHVNILTGTLLHDGLPPGELPRLIRLHTVLEGPFRAPTPRAPRRRAP